ncbi:helix-turn-helix domain-containing protein [Thiomicrorhabdus xiamenensis]|uniref:Winged helix-turn-helix domain-containing protein n=1 Tax=Thiomicrorhabdus xiamenensis TaxID=2739063 RepID=A0A7D4SIV4_9GAMM|nr:helix-turn-helix domain-containing protein [Thiomicrorhabdus xiamenensis]QKI89219.1 hypothetical protein HQN79_06400 [Thiomicrorhabdus xiamenensis]
MEASRNTQDNATAQAELFHSSKCPVIRTAKEYRFFKVLVQRPVTRQELDEIAGVANSPDIVLKLRKAGWVIDTGRMSSIDQDGSNSNAGYYTLAGHQKECALEALDLYRQARGGKHA